MIEIVMCVALILGAATLCCASYFLGVAASDREWSRACGGRGLLEDSATDGELVWKDSQKYVPNGKLRHLSFDDG